MYSPYPMGGIPLAVEVAKKLGSNLDIIIPHKIPIPDNPEAGYGEVTEDGVIALNEHPVRQRGLTRQQIERHAEVVRAEIRRRQAVYRTILMASSVGGKTAIIVDDGLASGYTMMAAIRSIWRQGAAKVVADRRSRPRMPGGLSNCPLMTWCLSSLPIITHLPSPASIGIGMI